MADIQKTRNQYVMVSPWEPFNLTEKSGYRNNNNKTKIRTSLATTPNDEQDKLGGIDSSDHKEKQE